jgi:hypothetical protein
VFARNESINIVWISDDVGGEDEGLCCHEQAIGGVTQSRKRKKREMENKSQSATRSATYPLRESSPALRPAG